MGEEEAVEAGEVRTAPAIVDGLTQTEAGETVAGVAGGRAGEVNLATGFCEDGCGVDGGSCLTTWLTAGAGDAGVRGSGEAVPLPFAVAFGGRPRRFFSSWLGGDAGGGGVGGGVIA